MGSSATFQITSWQQLANHFPGVQPLANLELNGDIEFRSYQAVAAATSIFSGFRGVIRAATGSGKTLIAAGICGAMLPKRSVIMIHGRELVAQTYKKLCTYLGKENVGVISSEEFEPRAVTIASIDTFSFYMGKLPIKKDPRTGKPTGVPIMDPKVFEKLADTFANYLENEVDMLVFDEVHHGSADTWQAVGKYSRAYYRVGLSGTPLKQDNLSDMLMMSLVGPVVFDLHAPWLQREGYLADARLEIRRLDYTDSKNRGLKWQDAKKKLLVKNSDRMAHIAGDIAQDISNSKTRLLVLTGNSVEIAENLEEELIALARPLTRKLGYRPFVMVTGKTSSRKTSKAFNDLRKGEVRCVITTKLADEGIDVPNINLLYLVGGGKAYVSTVQRVGRGLRVKDGGEELLVVDYFTRGNKHLEKHDRKRLKTYKEEAFFKEITVNDVA